MKRGDFVFSIGYQGESAIIDKQAKNMYGMLSSAELAEKGLFRAAFNSALYSENNEETESVLAIYNRKSGAGLPSVESMKRMLGVFKVPDKIIKVTLI